MEIWTDISFYCLVYMCVHEHVGTCVCKDECTCVFMIVEARENLMCHIEVLSTFLLYKQGPLLAWNSRSRQPGSLVSESMCPPPQACGCKHLLPSFVDFCGF